MLVHAQDCHPCEGRGRDSIFTGGRMTENGGQKHVGPSRPIDVSKLFSPTFHVGFVPITNYLPQTTNYEPRTTNEVYPERSRRELQTTNYELRTLFRKTNPILTFKNGA